MLADELRLYAMINAGEGLNDGREGAKDPLDTVVNQLAAETATGSLYILALTDIRWLGAVTPFGGTAFLLGWGALAWHARQSRAP